MPPYFVNTASDVGIPMTTYYLLDPWVVMVVIRGMLLPIALKSP